MTDLSNGHQPTTSDTATPGAGNGMSPSIISRLPEIREMAKAAQVHPKQAHLDTLIEASIVTHLIKVDTVQDPIFALSQMQELSEISFAAIFEDGLVALGCHTQLPAALAKIAVPAVSTGLKRAKQSNGLQRIEQVSKRLETLVDQMEPEEIVVNEQMGRAIIERLSSLEAEVGKTAVVPADTGIEILQTQISALEDRLVGLTDPTDALNKIMNKLAGLEKTPPAAPDQTALQKQMEECTTAIMNATQQMHAAAAEVVSRPAEQGDASAQLAELLPQLEQAIVALSEQTTFVDQPAGKIPHTSALARHPEMERVTEKIDQLGNAQRAAFTRVEAAITKAVAGLAPALDHLDARADDTEMMMANWQKDLKLLSQHTRVIADSAEQLPPVFVALQGDFDRLANAPAPVVDLSAQNDSLASFGAQLGDSLKEIEAFAQRSGQQSAHAAAQSDETIATLQTLPKLISATLRHEIDLHPVKDSLAALKAQLSALPKDMNLARIATDLETLSNQMVPIRKTQTVEFDAMRTSIQAVLHQLQSVNEGMSELQSKDLNLTPLNDLIKDLIADVETQLGQSIQSHDSQFAHLNDGLTGLARHLGLAPQAAPPLLPASQLAPETSLNTLRMEFADLIGKRMQENRAPLPDQAHKSTA